MNKKILIVDDNETNLKILTLILKKDAYRVLQVTDPKVVRSLVLQEKPDLILLDVNMPDINGFDLAERLKKDPQVEDIPIIFISALSNSSDVAKGFAVGAVDYITKPYKAEEARVRIKTHLKMVDMKKELEEKNKHLMQIVEQQVRKTSEAQMETIFSLAKLAQSRDDDTGKHLERVQKYCYALATELAKSSPYKNEITKSFVKNIVYASPLHDIGKVAISDSILLKPGRLTPEEFNKMKYHTTYGADTLSEVHKKFGTNDFIEMGVYIARYHHERWDGSGYPENLQGEDIPLCARIMAIADVYDALASRRVYKDAFPHEKCVDIMKEGRGTQFDPYILDAFMTINQEFKKIRDELEE